MPSSVAQDRGKIKRPVDPGVSFVRRASEPDEVGNLLRIGRFATGAAGSGIFLVAPNKALVGANEEIKSFGLTSPPSSNQVAFNGTTATVRA